LQGISLRIEGWLNAITVVLFHLTKQNLKTTINLEL